MPQSFPPAGSHLEATLLVGALYADADTDTPEAVAEAMDATEALVEHLPLPVAAAAAALPPETSPLPPRLSVLNGAGGTGNAGGAGGPAHSSSSQGSEGAAAAGGSRGSNGSPPPPRLPSPASAVSAPRDPLGPSPSLLSFPSLPVPLPPSGPASASERARASSRLALEPLLIPLIPLCTPGDSLPEPGPVRGAAG